MNTENASSPPPPARKLPRALQIGIVLVAAAGVAAVVGLSQVSDYLFGAKPKEAEQAAAAQPTDSFKPTEGQWAGFKIAPVKLMTFAPTQRTDGVIASNDDHTTPVYSPFSGLVTRLIAKPGDVVKKGDPLFAIAASEFVQAQNDLTSAIATSNTAKAQLRLAVTAEKRAHDLFLAQGGALKDWQQAQLDLATAQGGDASAQIALAAVRNRLRILGRTPEQIAAMEASPSNGTFDGETIVPAPIGGTVISRQIGPGQNIVSASSGGSTPVFTIGDLSSVWLIANVREEDAPSVHVGDEAEVRVLAYPGRVFKAKVTYVSAMIDPNIRRLPVRAEVDNTDGALKPQMFANFSIVTGAGRQSPGVPEKAVVYEGDSAHVWAANPANKTLALRQIKYGRLQDGMLEVLDGLKPTDSVVTSGAVFIDRAVDPN